MSDTTSFSATASPPERWAQVQAADQLTRYVRRGVGHPVLVLQDREGEADVWPAVIEALSAYCRVLLPEPPEANVGFISWICGFLDGIGLTQVTLVAAGRFCVPALELALLDTDRLAGLVLVPRGHAEQTGLTGTLGSTPGASSVPVLVVRRECPAGIAVARVERFFDALNT